MFPTILLEIGKFHWKFIRNYRISKGENTIFERIRGIFMGGL